MRTKFFFAFLLLVSFLSASPAWAAESTLSLSPTTGSYSVGDTFDLQVILNTGSDQTTAVDVILNYDPTLVQVQTITEGALLSTYLGESIDNTQGRAAISAVASDPSEVFQGQGTFATFTFQAQASGTAAITFDFTPAAVNDCNVAYAGSDMLVAVTNGNYQIEILGAGGSLPTTTPTATPTTATNTSTPTATPTTTTSLPVSGSLPPTLLAGFLGTISLIIGGILLFL